MTAKKVEPKKETAKKVAIEKRRKDAKYKDAIECHFDGKCVVKKDASHFDLDLVDKYVYDK